MAGISIRNLTVEYRIGQSWYPAVRNFTLDVPAGEIYGLVGESGSGKTTVAMAVMRSLGNNGRIRGGEIVYDGVHLESLGEAELREIWGKRIALVPQNPLSALNPSLRVGEQIAETLVHHERLPRRRAAARAVELLDQMQIGDPERAALSYPHQISGGMQQRAMIAMALSTEPGLLVLDEPTTNLDVTTQAAILDLIHNLIAGKDTSVLYVTHNLGVVARFCRRVAVMYAGELVEEAETAGLFNQPLHPYTDGLLESVPQPGKNKASVRLRAIPGRIPSLVERRQEGCVFVDRCPLAIERCQERPALIDTGKDVRVRCHRWEEIASGEIEALREAPQPENGVGGASPASGGPLIRMENLEVHFDRQRTLADSLAGRSPGAVRAVDGLTLEIDRGLTLGLVGESGSGKTTLARAIVGLVGHTSGTISLLGSVLPSGLAGRDPETLRQLQYVFQNPHESLNPYMTVGESLSRPLETLLGRSSEESAKAVPKLLEAVRLPQEYADRLPAQLSGGEKQRVAIARAFASNPELLIADEAVSALDVSVQASILGLLNDLQTEFGSALLFISHDLSVVGYLADVVAVMYAGALMEISSSEALFEPPHHPYTEALLSAIPVPDPAAGQEVIFLEGELPGETGSGSGCPFHARCPRGLGQICREVAPPWQVTAKGKRIYCHIPLEELDRAQRQGSA